MKKNRLLFMALCSFLLIYLTLFLLCIGLYCEAQKNHNANIIEDNLETAASLENNLVDNYIRLRESTFIELANNITLEEDIKGYLTTSKERLGLEAIYFQGKENYEIGELDKINIHQDGFFVYNKTLYISYSFKGKDFNIYATELFNPGDTINMFFDGNATTVVKDSNGNEVYYSKSIDIDSIKIKHYSNSLNLKSSKDYDYYGYTLKLNTSDYYLLLIVPTSSLGPIVINRYISNILLIGSILFVISALIYAILSILFVRQKSITLNEQAGLFNQMFDHFREAFVVYDIERKKIVFISNNIMQIIGLSKEEVLANLELKDINGNGLGQDITKIIINKQDQNIKNEFQIYNKYTNCKNTIRVRSMELNYYNQKCYGIILGDIRTEIINRTRLYVKLKKVEDDLNGMQNFMSKISHEIRTPLNGIEGMTTLIQEHIKSGNTDEAIKCLNILKDKSNDLEKIVVNSLNIPKYENSIVNIQVTNVKLSDVLNEVRDIINPTLADKNLYLLEKKNITDVEVLIDKEKFQQIILNLFSNSILYCKQNGKINLTIEAVLIDNKVHFSLTLEDNGYGMPSFDDSALLDSNNPKYNNLGLTLVKNYVKLFNGKINITSKSTGSKVTVDIILDTYIPEKDTNDIDTLDNSFDYSKINALVAEDNDINWMVLENHLKKKNIKYVRTKNGQEAFDVFNKSKINEFNLVLMDIQMPILDGYHSAEKIRNSKRKDCNIKIIAISADAYEDDIKKALSFGMNAHVAKPINVNILYQTIEEELKS